MNRNTEQKKAIREIFHSFNRPLTADEVHQLARKKLNNIGLATVYRNLKSLCEDDWLKTVEIPGDSNRYERKDISHHHHFQCEECGKVFDIPGCPGDIERLLPEGYLPNRHEVLIFGKCPNCHIDDLGIKK